MKLKTTYLLLAFLFVNIMNAQTSSETIQEVKIEKLETNGEPIYREVEVMASYRGGYDVLLKNIEAATKNCKKGRYNKKNPLVIAEVLIGKEGKVLDVKIVKAEVILCNNEIINALRKTTQWIPARINNKPVNSYIQIIINLNNYYKSDKMTAGLHCNDKFDLHFACKDSWN